MGPCMRARRVYHCARACMRKHMECTSRWIYGMHAARYKGYQLRNLDGEKNVRWLATTASSTETRPADHDGSHRIQPQAEGFKEADLSTAVTGQLTVASNLLQRPPQSRNARPQQALVYFNLLLSHTSHPASRLTLTPPPRRQANIQLLAPTTGEPQRQNLS